MLAKAPSLRIVAAALLLGGGVWACFDPGAYPSVRTTGPVEALRGRFRAAGDRCHVGNVIARNGTAAFLLILGLVSGGLFAAFGLVFLGWLFASQFVWAMSLGLPRHVVLAAVVPHGILEIWGFWLAGTVGLRGFSMARWYLSAGRNPGGEPVPLKSLLARETLQAAALIVLAGLFECLVTPWFLDYATRIVQAP